MRENLAIKSVAFFENSSNVNALAYYGSLEIKLIQQFFNENDFSVLPATPNITVPGSFVQPIISYQSKDSTLLYFVFQDRVEVWANIFEETHFSSNENVNLLNDRCIAGVCRFIKYLGVGVIRISLLNDFFIVSNDKNPLKPLLNHRFFEETPVSEFNMRFNQQISDAKGFDRIINQVTTIAQATGTRNDINNPIEGVLLRQDVNTFSTGMLLDTLNLESNFDFLKSLIIKKKTLVCTGDLINPLLIGFFGKDLSKSDHFMCQNRHLKELFHLVIHRNATACIDEPEQIQPVLKIFPFICRVLSHESLQASMDCVYRSHRVVIV